MPIIGHFYRISIKCKENNGGSQVKGSQGRRKMNNNIICRCIWKHHQRKLPKIYIHPPKNSLKMITQLNVLEQCYTWHDKGKTDFSVQNLGQTLDSRAAKKWSTLTGTQATNAAIYVQMLVEELLGEVAEDEQK